MQSWCEEARQLLSLLKNFRFPGHWIGGVPMKILRDIISIMTLGSRSDWMSIHPTTNCPSSSSSWQLQLAWQHFILRTNRKCKGSENWNFAIHVLATTLDWAGRSPADFAGCTGGTRQTAKALQTSKIAIETLQWNVTQKHCLPKNQVRSSCFTWTLSAQHFKLPLSYPFFLCFCFHLCPEQILQKMSFHM